MNEKMDPREGAAMEMRNKAIQEAVEGKIIPGRSFLDQPEMQGVVPVDTQYEEDRRPKGFTADLGNGQSLERSISYVDADGQRTDAIKSISEFHRTVEADDGQTKQVKEIGRDLDQVNAYEATITTVNDKDGKQISKTTEGRSTEGEKIGEEWRNSETIETRGDVTKRSRLNSGKHFKDGKLVEYTTVKANYSGADGKDFYYISREYDEKGKLVVPDEDNKMKWRGNVPPDFPEW